MDLSCRMIAQHQPTRIPRCVQVNPEFSQSVSLPLAPASARQPAPGKHLSRIGGAWWWALLDAAVGDPEAAYALVPGLAVAVGEAEAATARATHESDQFERLARPSGNATR